MRLKNLVLVAVFSFMVQGIYAQNDQLSTFDQEAEWTLNMSELETFKHVKLPRKNFIIKKGGIANYNSLQGLKLKIKSKPNSDDYFLVRADGRKFFNKYKTICIDPAEAVKSGEIVKVSS